MKPDASNAHPLVTLLTTDGAGSSGDGWLRRAWQQGLRCAKHRAAVTLLLTLFAQGAALLTSVVLARLMAVELYGHYQYGLSWALLLAQMAVLGFDRLAVREVAATSARGNLAELHGFVRFAFSRVLLVALAVTLLVWVTGFLLERFTSVGVPKSFGWAILVVPPMVLLTLLLSVVRGTNQVVASQLPEKLFRPTAFLTLLAGLILLGGEASLPMVYSAFLASAVGACLWAWRDLRRFLPSLPAGLAPTSRPREWWASNLHLGTAVIMFAINARADSLLLGTMAGARDVAIYFVALRISQSTSLTLGVFNSLLGPNISARHAINDVEGLRGLARKYALAIVGVNLLSVLPVVLFRHPLVGLFGSDFLPAVTPLLILCLGQMVQSLAGPAGSFLVYCNQESQSAKIFTATCAANIALNVLLIPRFGAIGAAIAATATLSLKSVWSVWVCLRHLKINPTPLPFPVLATAATPPSP